MLSSNMQEAGNWIYKIIKISFDPKRIFWLMLSFILDVKYGGRSLRKSLNNGDTQLGYCYTGNSSYEALRQIFSKVQLHKDDVIIDIGCGKGRMFNWLLHKKIKNKLVGIEVDVQVAEFTRRRLSAYPQVDIITGDFACIGASLEASIFYLYNPFRENLIKELERILLAKIVAGSSSTAKRPLIIYHYARFLHVFESNPVWEIQKLDFKEKYATAIIGYRDMSS